jgi:hypothetical protein
MGMHDKTFLQTYMSAESIAQIIPAHFGEEKMMNRFYVGATHIGEAFGRGVNAPDTHPTLEDAISDATNKLRNDPSLKCCVVVQIVRVVRKDYPPITVEIV